MSIVDSPASYIMNDWIAVIAVIADLLLPAAVGLLCWCGSAVRPTRASPCTTPTTKMLGECGGVAFPLFTWYHTWYRLPAPSIAERQSPGAVSNMQTLRHPHPHTTSTCCTGAVPRFVAVDLALPQSTYGGYVVPTRSLWSNPGVSVRHECCTTYE